MNTQELILSLAEGLGNNILITVLSAIFPLGIGILLSFFASKSRIAQSVFSWLSLPFECICPVLLLVTMYYLPTSIFRISPSSLLIAVITFSICFFGYMPARFVRSDSFLKNMLSNGIGLISSIFKWSFCVGFIGLNDILRASQNIMYRTYEHIWFIIPLFISIVFILILELAKRLVKQFMK